MAKLVIINKYTRIIVEDDARGLRIFIASDPPLSSVRIHAVMRGEDYNVSVYVVRDIIIARHPGHRALVRTYIEHKFWGNPAEYRFSKLMNYVNKLMKDEERR